MRLRLLVPFLFIVPLAFLPALPQAAVPVADAQRPSLGPPIVSQSLKNDTSPPLREMRPYPRAEGQDRVTEVGRHNRRVPSPAVTDPTASQPPRRDPVLQAAAPVARMPAATVNVEGNSNNDNASATNFLFFPPDTNGDVGPNHYVQMVNLIYSVYNKSGTRILGPLDVRTLWQGFGGACETARNGDVIVMYDSLADRWFLSRFARLSDAGPFLQCIAISQTADPTGAFYRYAFSYAKFNDFPKFAVWPDAYYGSINQFLDAAGGPFAGSGVIAYDRNRMLVGLSAIQVFFDTCPASTNCANASLLPSSLDGRNPPPPGSPNYFMGLGASSSLRIFEFHVDFANPPASTFVGPTVVTTAPFDANLCNQSLDCIPQPETTQRLDVVGDRLMWRLGYRNFGTHETMVSSHTVDVDDTDHAGIRWYELRKVAGGAWSIFQQGTYAPDAHHRWMGSIAMDSAGNIAVGYNVSSSSVFPSVRYVGRLASDPPGTLSQDETILVAGGGSQEGTNRWGDYSSMNVDPSDDCTFWYTNEYYTAANHKTIRWNTRIGSFRFPNCAVPPTRRPSTTGVFRPSNGLTFLKSQNSTGFADADLVFGVPGDKPLAGDWTGKGFKSIGVYRNGQFLLRNSNTTGFADITVAFGAPSDLPIAGDWNGDGVDSIGVYRDGTFYLRNSNSTGPADLVVTLGVPGDVPIAGDWTAKGFDSVGVFRPSNGALFLRNSNTTGIADIQVAYGLPGDKPVVGDWDGNGTDTIGVYRNGAFLLRNSNAVGFADISFALGLAGDEPIAGNWGTLPPPGPRR